MTGLLPATNSGLLVGSAVGGDVLSVVLQVGVLLIVTAALRRNRDGWMVVAGVLAGLAACSKLTGVWAALAVLSWLAFRQDWRRCAWFLLACGSSVALTLGIVQWASQGRFLTTFLMLTFAGTGGPVGLTGLLTNCCFSQSKTRRPCGSSCHSRCSARSRS